MSTLPKVKIVRHVRAKSLRLRVYSHQICLTVPPRCSQGQIDQFLKQSEAWLIETWQKVGQQNAVDFPIQLQLFGQNKPTQIQRIEQKNLFQFDGSTNTLFLQHNNAALALKRFIVEYAKVVLPQKLQQNSLSINLPFQGLQVRHAKSRWGSCSSKHKIMLNAALVLLPEALIDYVCIHELVHTQHFDHSPAFWRAVRQFDPNYLQHQQQLKQFKWPAWWLEA
ncbi:SprT family zinc-dependent metalloprotease [Acinetobacter sp. MD2]|uniref:M48 family metallopeptidase n=1 Tax=Acinetobacter sp. MD2 TaxID=2600066 RepID=UPI002D1EA893|nr:SprT family zinc-dependent metalloprotease [Acinetobacter sp. MD2]MEB3766532.1 M48 family metallopeptidase [Acinetobacter sp. MD2]